MAEAKLNGGSRREATTPEPGRGRRPASDVNSESEQIRQNSIRPSNHAKSVNSRSTQPESEPQNRQPEGKKPRDRAREIPEDVRKRFTQVGNQFFFPDGTRAFTDRGSRIISRSENSGYIDQNKMPDSYLVHSFLHR